MDIVIEFKNVVKEYTTGEHTLKAVDNVSFNINSGINSISIHNGIFEIQGVIKFVRQWQL